MRRQTVRRRQTSVVEGQQKEKTANDSDRHARASIVPTVQGQTHNRGHEKTFKARSMRGALYCRNSLLSISQYAVGHTRTGSERTVWSCRNVFSAQRVRIWRALDGVEPGM